MQQMHLFTKELTQTHIDYNLTIPIAALKAFPIPEGAHIMDFEAVDAIGLVWQFRLTTRMTGPYPKPILLRSFWHSFVKEKGLIPNDRVTFSVEKDEANRTRYAVRAQRKIMALMGQNVWVNVEDLHLYGL